MMAVYYAGGREDQSQQQVLKAELKKGSFKPV